MSDVRNLHPSRLSHRHAQPHFARQPRRQPVTCYVDFSEPEPHHERGAASAPFGAASIRPTWSHQPASPACLRRFLRR